MDEKLEKALLNEGFLTRIDNAKFHKIPLIISRHLPGYVDELPKEIRVIQEENDTNKYTIHLKYKTK